MGLSPGRATIFSSPVTLVGQCGYAARAMSIKKCMSCGTSIVPSGFRDESNEAGANVKGRTSGSIAQLAECSHGKREALGSSSSQP